MDVRLPRPIHGWRLFLGEVGIIVIGVLIALSAERVASNINDRNVAARTRAAITNEINENLSSIALRGQAEPCIDRRLVELRALFEDWAKSGGFKTPMWVAQATTLGVSMARYEAALSSGDIALLPSEEQYRLGIIAAQIRDFEEIQDQQQLPWGRLRALQAGSRNLTQSDRTMLLTALQEASTLNYLAKLNVRQALPIAKRYGFTPDYQRFASDAGDVWAGGKFTPSICTSIDTPPDEANKTQIVPLPL